MSSCSLWFKDTNLKANHNWVGTGCAESYAVLYGSKILIWKQITTQGQNVQLGMRCSLWFKDTNLKANHNKPSHISIVCLAVLYGSKILIWKQITTLIFMTILNLSCSLWFKDTNLKANHNTILNYEIKFLAVLYGSKILIWKQITTRCTRTVSPSCCSLWFKDTNLKANHNCTVLVCLNSVAVLYGSKILIWKQITTRCLGWQSEPKLFFMVQRY